MRAPVTFVSLVCSTLFALAATTVGADTECFKGFRDTTPGERATMTKVLENVVRALPPAPEGWTLNSSDELYVTPRVCRDDEAEPWSYDFSRSYQRVDNLDERDKIFADAGAKLDAATKANQPRVDAIMARIQELSMAAVAAAEKQDYAKVDALNVEIEQASAEMGRIMAGTYEELDAANEEANRDTDIRIEVEVNSGHESPGYGAEKMTAPSGAEQAFRRRVTEGSVTEETVLVLFGRWRTSGDALEPVPRANAAPTAAQAISVRVTADESRIESVLESIDFARLASSLSR